MFSYEQSTPVDGSDDLLALEVLLEVERLEEPRRDHHGDREHCKVDDLRAGTPLQYRGKSLIRNRTPLGPYRRPMPKVLGGWTFSHRRDAHVWCVPLPSQEAMKP